MPTCGVDLLHCHDVISVHIEENFGDRGICDGGVDHVVHQPSPDSLDVNQVTVESYVPGSRTSALLSPFIQRVARGMMVIPKMLCLNAFG